MNNGQTGFMKKCVTYTRKWSSAGMSDWEYFIGWVMR